MDTHFFARGFAAGPGRYEPLGARALTAPFLDIWEDTAVFDFIAGLRPPLDIAAVRSALAAGHSYGAWQRQPAAAGEAPDYALVSLVTGHPTLGLYTGDGPCEQRGIWDEAAPDAPRAAWAAALTGLSAHVFANLPAAEYAVVQLRLVVPELQHEALMLAGWEPFGQEPSHSPRRAGYRLLREVHAMYTAPA